MEFLKYKDVDVSLMLESLSPTELDDLPYGVIKLDQQGMILQYNTTESFITGRVATLVIGKNFFTEVAPCTNTPEFYGRFVEGFEKKFLNTVFNYLFDHNMKPVSVKVHMILAKYAKEYYMWIIVKRVLRHPAVLKSKL